MILIDKSQKIVFQQTLDLTHKEQCIKQGLQLNKSGQGNR
jgi:hypothetical protein